MLPGHVLAHYLVVFDYPAGKFTLARKNAWQPKGTPLPMPVGRTGYPRTEIEVAGTPTGNPAPIYHGPHGGPLSLAHWQQKTPPPEGHSFHETNVRQARTTS